ncbi:MAG: aminodeoxychorismate synthase component I, partial [Candidatus Omnitrophica bacterium]|nr:aminodeoxychorismate synthase component I [Candidatus Omnitrophota bacterium]MBD3268741.1 aminodeoxychorismate synthase component I [Candidatus Omnitrophota bacterium]
FWLAGFFSYEFGYFLEPCLHKLGEHTEFPLVWLGVCRKPEMLNWREHLLSCSGKRDWKMKDFRADIKLEEYKRKIRKIKDYLEEGLTYQVNFTFKMNFNFYGEPLHLYCALKDNQPVPYPAFINTGRFSILSLSPELFFRTEGEKVVTSPMKGTSRRGLDSLTDECNEKLLKESSKNRAENLMIVDLLRNDLGRICDKVRVKKLFETEKYRTLYQMTSTIEAHRKRAFDLKELFRALFPCGSVTGAPKIKTMEIINKLEKEKRGIYTGAIGYVSPHKQKSCFNVSIRTVSIKGNKAEMGIGGGIVYDSKPYSEYREALLKASFLRRRPFAGRIFETMLYRKAKGFYLLDLHLNRLNRSCSFFGIDFNRNKAKRLLKKQVDTEGKDLRVRLNIDIRGKMEVEKEELDKIKSPVKVILSRRTTDPKNLFLYHKTTCRFLYDRERKDNCRGGIFEVIFFNKRGEVTEGTISNIFVLKNARLYTPPLKSGVLPGVLRKHLISKGKCREKVLYFEDLKEAEKIYVGNSLRGLMEAEVKWDLGTKWLGAGKRNCETKIV